MLARRRFMRGAVAAAALPLLPAAGLAQSSAGPGGAGGSGWPGGRPITFIVPFAAGGGTDVATRAVAQLMGRELGTSFVVENRPGANSFIGAQTAARAAPDGHTFFMTSLTTHSINPYLFKSLPYSPADFVPVGFLVTTSPVLFTASGNPVSDVQGILKQAAGRPEGLNFAVPNASARFATLMFGLKAGMRITEINFNSTPQAHAEVAAGRVDYLFGDFSAGGGLHDGGKIKPLAVAAPRRLATHPEIRTMGEQGVPGVEVEIWAGLFAPKGTPEEPIRRVNAALLNAMKDPSVQDILKRGSQESMPMSPAQFGAYVEAQNQHWGSMARALDIRPE